MKIDFELFEREKAAAKLNASKKIDDLAVGDFLYLTEGTLKNEDFADALLDIADGHTVECLVQIEKITTCTEKEMLKNAYKFGAGGSRADVFDGDYKLYNLQKDDFKYFYSLVTLVKTKSGKYFFVDSQGYDYPRYLMIRPGTLPMFAAIIDKRRQQEAKWKQKIREQWEKDAAKLKAKQEKEIAQNWAFLNPEKSLKWNWIQACKHLFDFSVKVRKMTDYHRDEQIKIICQNGEQEETVKQKLIDLERFFIYYPEQFENYYYNRLNDHIPHMLGNVYASIYD